MQEATLCDAQDGLAPFREKFMLPAGMIYLDGNSLGALPKATPARLQQVITQEWGQDLIQSWNKHQWLDAPLRIGDKLTRLLGARPGEVVVADSTSINIFKLLSAALPLRPERRVILADSESFPTDLYMVQGLIQLLGQDYRLRLVATEALSHALNDEVALVLLSQVNYKTGALLDIAQITTQAHDAGALIVWDLAHSCGVIPLELTAWNVDFAVGCGYKYLNGGPGAPAFLYVAHTHQATVQPLLSGWLGHVEPFSFVTEYHPAPGIRRHLCGTPPILSLLALECGVDLLLEADLHAIREKSMALGDFFIAQMTPLGFSLASPRNAEDRGSQVAFRHPQGYAIIQALIAEGVIGDFRAPDILRFGFAPLYVSFSDVAQSVAILHDIMATGRWDQPAFHQRQTVT
jgi:kynureninase